MKHFYLDDRFGENWFNYQDIYSLFVKKASDNGIIVEVGSWKGRSAAYLAVEIINSGKQISLECVDTWLGSEEHTEDSHVKQGTLFEVFLQNTSPVSHIITPRRMQSVDAAILHEDKTLDAVFIDANHAYANVVQDLNAWVPKIKSGGLIAGHDFHPDWPGVVAAVKDFFKDNYQHMCLLGDSWMVYL